MAFRIHINFIIVFISWHGLHTPSCSTSSPHQWPHACLRLLETQKLSTRPSADTYRCCTAWEIVAAARHRAHAPLAALRALQRCAAPHRCTPRNQWHSRPPARGRLAARDATMAGPPRCVRAASREACSSASHTSLHLLLAPPAVPAHKPDATTARARTHASRTRAPFLPPAAGATTGRLMSSRRSGRTTAAWTRCRSG